jgi:nitrite reductase/ring-hydroxylating ferredoxin subunit
MNDPDRFNRALESLLSDRSPREDVQHLDEEEIRMVQMAQLLRGTRRERPRDEFVESLRTQLFPARQRVSRRTAFFSGLGALAAGILAGLGLDRATRGSSGRRSPIVGSNGRWISVARVAEAPEGSITAFTAGAVQGFLLNRSGQYRALSRICTHMGCTLQFQHSDQAFVCPCHGAEFNTNGQMRYEPRRYPFELPPLPEINVRVHGDSVQVWAV